MANVPNAVEKLPKITTASVGCTNVTDDRQTTGGRATAYSERERANVNASSCSLKMDKMFHVWQGKCTHTPLVPVLYTYEPCTHHCPSTYFSSPVSVQSCISVSPR